jgi:hypothetical protein
VSDLQGQKGSKEMSASPLQIGAAFMDALTTPDSEDWTLLVDGDTVHVTAYREVVHAGEQGVMVKSGEGTIADIKAIVRDLPTNHDLGCVSVILCSDAGKRASDLLCRLTKMARKRGFSVISCFGPSTTAEAVQTREAILQEWSRVMEPNVP